MNDEIYVPPGGPPRVNPPSREIYELMGEANIYLMLADFYGELEQSPLRPMFPENMEAASTKSAAFFIGMFGGPPIYHMRYGNPMMRARHMPFSIDEAARQVWLGRLVVVLVRLVTWLLPGFCRWPMTYRWDGRLCDGEVTGSWHRTTEPPYTLARRRARGSAPTRQGKA